jgi:S-(hydroxymethyl)glutathione dehydrogenase/alcohol dehydrogenase
MKAAVLHSSPGRLEIEDLATDKPTSREVLVRTAHAGLCHSDLHFMDGAWQVGGATVMGHEGAGIVEAVGSDVTHVKPGDHVITCVSIFCGQCKYCLSGRPHLCSGRSQVVARDKPALRDGKGESVSPFASLGCFAEEMLVHEHALVKIRDDMPLDIAALIGCGDHRAGCRDPHGRSQAWFFGGSDRLRRYRPRGGARRTIDERRAHHCGRRVGREARERSTARGDARGQRA